MSKYKAVLILKESNVGKKSIKPQNSHMSSNTSKMALMAGDGIRKYSSVETG